MLLNETIFFILPLLLAGLIHHLVIIPYNICPSLARPIDNNIKLKGKSLLGKSKTWRGIFTLTLLAGVFYYLAGNFWQADFKLPVFISGMLLGLGYALGELPNSFAKRRLDISASETNYQGSKKIFYVIDQVDSVIGAIILLFIVYNPSLALVFLILFFGSLLHYLADLALHRFSYKKNRR